MATSSNPRPHRSHNRLRPVIWGGAAALLLCPAVAMQFTSEVNWDAFDFVAMGTLLATTCGLYEIGAWLSSSRAYRAAFAIALSTGFLTIWVNLAVGMFGREDNATNLLFGSVLIVAAAGTLVARFRAQSMAWAMGFTAVTQWLAVAVGLALVAGPEGDGTRAARDYYDAFLSACFALPWLASSMLFRAASQARDAECNAT